MSRTFPPRARLPDLPAAGAGFSLVELIVVIVISGIIAGMLGAFITGPITGFLDTARRAELVDAGQLAMIGIGRDLRGALPNSVRISGSALEILASPDGDRYRTEPSGGGTPASAADQLAFDTADTSFNTFRRLGVGQTLTGTLRLAVYPLGPGTVADPYAAATTIPGGTEGVLTPATTSVVLGTTVAINGTTEHRVALTPGHRFPYESPTHRVYLVTGPVTWLCNGRNLERHDGYAVSPAQSVPPTGGSVTSVVSDLVQSCSFNYAAGTAYRNAVVTVALELADVDSPLETVKLVRQLHLGNSP